MWHPIQMLKVQKYRNGIYSCLQLGFTCYWVVFSVEIIFNSVDKDIFTRTSR